MRIQLIDFQGGDQIKGTYVACICDHGKEQQSQYK